MTAKEIFTAQIEEQNQANVAKYQKQAEILASSMELCKRMADDLEFLSEYGISTDIEEKKSHDGYIRNMLNLRDTSLILSIGKNDEGKIWIYAHKSRTTFRVTVEDDNLEEVYKYIAKLLFPTEED